MKKLFPLFLGVLFPCLLKAQQDPRMSLFMFNKMWTNPAYAGFNQGMQASLLHRSQWVKHSGAPHSQIASFDTRFTETIGLGGNIINDNYGGNNRTDLVFNGAYFLRLGEESQLSFGLRGGISFVQVKPVEVWDENDPSFQETNQTHFIPRIGGAIYYQLKGFELGLSLPNLLQYDSKGLYLEGGEGTFSHPRNIELNMAYTHEFNDQWSIQPNVIYQGYGFQTNRFDLNVMGFFQKKYGVGLTYGVGRSMSMIASAKVGDRFSLAYSFELTTNKDYRDGGSHEIMVAFDFSGAKKKHDFKKKYYHK